jgi:hypothetical protein
MSCSFEIGVEVIVTTDSADYRASDRSETIEEQLRRKGSTANSFDPRSCLP